jgi:renalase
MSTEQRTVAIVGAGISGLVCAQRLKASGFSVVVFEKARGPGGRITTRRRAEERFDHGAQYCTVQSDEFATAVRSWFDAGVMAPWMGRFASWSSGVFSAVEPRRMRWVGTPRMSAIGRHMARDLNLHLSTRIVRLEALVSGWRLHTDDGAVWGPFDAVVLSCPGPQAAALLPEESPTHIKARQLEYASCWAVMMGFDSPVVLPFDGVQWSHPVLAWSARDSSKPGRADGERWVVHTQPEWSDAHLEDDQNAVAELVAEQWQTLTGAKPNDISAHRWRFSLAESSLDEPAYFDSDMSLGLCGDGLTGPRIEDAWHSGCVMASQIEEALD